MTTPLLTQLIDALRCLPGVGPKTAQRMAFHLLERDRDGARHLAKVIDNAVNHIGHCQQCRNFSEEPLCTICRNGSRERRVLCVVETPADLLAIEQATGYRGVYFILMGRLSPLDGIGPDELHLDQLDARLSESGLEEVILATSPTVEGEATAHFITQMAHKYGKKVSRIAYGVPVGGDLESVDSGTLSRAFSGRQAMI